MSDEAELFEAELLPGTLDLLILKAVSLGPLLATASPSAGGHGYGFFSWNREAI